MQAAGAEDVDIAVKAARRALKDPSWKCLSATGRGKLMVRLSELVEQHKEILATIEAWDNGQGRLQSFFCAECYGILLLTP